ncbi:MAG: hypothetical protein ACI4KF_07140 [Huintestinicola sp.]
MENLSDLLIDPKTAEKFNRLFRSSLKKHKLYVDRRMSDNYYRVTDGETVLGFDITKSRYKYAKTRSIEDITELTDKVRREFEVLERMVSFTNGQEFLRFTVMRSQEVTRDMISEDFLGNLKKVICYSQDNVTCRILDTGYMKKWEVPREVLFSVADRNMCRILRKTKFGENVIRDSKNGSGIRCLEFKAEGNDLTAAMLMCSDFRNYIADILSPKFLVAVPSKDCMLVLSEVTNNILETLGTAIVNEYQWSPCPLTTDIFLYTSNGVQVAGHFSER